MPRNAGAPPPAPRRATPRRRLPAAAVSEPVAAGVPLRPAEVESPLVEAPTLEAALPVPFDRAADPDGPAIEARSIELAAAGRRARNRKQQAFAARPDGAFAVALRARLAPAILPESLSLLPEGLPPTPVQVRLVARPTARRRRLSLRTLAIVLLAVALVAVASVALAAGVFAPAAANRAGVTVDATLIRAGRSQALVAGTSLAAGDEIKTAATGSAVLLLGTNQTRLAGATDVQVTGLTTSTVHLALLSGRAYNRVVLPTGGTYAVATGPYAWTATGTAFDLTRIPLPAGGEQVTLLALEHAVSVAGPTGGRSIAEGSEVSVTFGSQGSDGLTVAPIPTSVFVDPWLISNAKSDEALGYPIGALAGVALAPNDMPTTEPSPTVTATDTPSTGPSTGPTDSPVPSADTSPTPGSTARPTPSPTPTASPSPSPTATPGTGLTLSPTSCPGAVVLTWTKYNGAGFLKYVTLRSSIPGIPKAYPPQAGASVVTSSTNRTTTSAFDAGATAGLTYFYRTLALGSKNAVLAASDVESEPAFGEADLGPASVGVPVGGPVVSWGELSDGYASCFSEYRVIWSDQSDPTMGNKTGSQIVSSRYLTYISVPPGFTGDTVYFKVQVLRIVGSGSFVVAETSGNVPSYTYP